jgi:8-oxo-dGTP pyrophosphatase MutT (NUDIX family)
VGTKNVVEHKIMRRGATFIALRGDGKVLMQLRDNNVELYPNMWTFPGGECEHERESTIDAAVREAYEEFGLRLNKDKGALLIEYSAPRDEEDFTEYVYVFPIENDQHPVLKEGADMKWMSLEEIENIELAFGKKNKILPGLKKFISDRK